MSDPDLSEFLDVRQDVDEPQPRRPHHPSGWEPGVDTAKGVIVAEPSEDPDPPQDWAEILAQFKLDPDLNGLIVEALDHPEGSPGRIADGLTSRGFRVSDWTVARHRNGRCCCQEHGYV